MKTNMRHNELSSLLMISHHLEFEYERLDTVKTSSQTFVPQSFKKHPNFRKRGDNGLKQFKNNRRKDQATNNMMKSRKPTESAEENKNKRRPSASTMRC